MTTMSSILYIKELINLTLQGNEIMETATDIKTAQKPSIALNQAFIQGKIIGKRKIKTQEGTLYLTLLRLPAQSEYDHPATVEIRSYEDLGDIDTNITQKVRLGGLPSNYETKSVDRQTGEEIKTPVRSARNEYTAI